MRSADLLIGITTVLTSISCATFCHAEEIDWSQLSGVEQTNTGYKTTGSDPWLLSNEITPPIDAERFCLLIEMKTTTPTRMQFFWMNGKEGTNDDRSVWINVHSKDFTTYAADLGQLGTFRGATRYRLDPSNRAGIAFDVKRIAFVKPHEIPQNLLPQMIDFRCYTSKLHYLPGERIEYRVAMNARCYPDRFSSKIVETSLINEQSETIATAVQQYSLRPNLQFKEIQNTFEIPTHLKPGKYTIKARSVDQRTGYTLTAQHAFGVQGEDDPYICETPFKFLKDFSLIQGPNGRYHIFSITGDFFGTHGWYEAGQERTFSHSSSADLRHWTMHPPVISITDEKHPDNNGTYKNRNVWAPHVIEHDGQYWMFYTSINDSVSQSISLATSKDLFKWTEHDNNPVFTLENADKFNWQRFGWADCRDPVVFKDDNGKFYIYVTANAKGPGECGAVAVAESDDLIHWRNPSVAVRAKIISESPQVWKVGNKYCMTTSSHGAATYVSDHPMHGWEKVSFPRPPIQEVEKYVHTSGTYAEEVIRLANGDYIMASITFRHYGNSIYFFRMNIEDGLPVSYDSPW